MIYDIDDIPYDINTLLKLLPLLYRLELLIVLFMRLFIDI